MKKYCYSQAESSNLDWWKQAQCSEVGFNVGVYHVAIQGAVFYDYQIRDKWLDEYYFLGVDSPNIPRTIESALKRKLDLLHAADKEQDLRVPPGNRFEQLSGKLRGWCSIRVNRQYRLIFHWNDGKVSGVFLDPHTYRKR